MQQEIDKDLLVKYLYKETTSYENAMIEEALENSWELRELFSNLESSRQALPKVTFSPKRTTIQNILRYNSEQTAFEHHY